MIVVFVDSHFLNFSGGVSGIHLNKFGSISILADLHCVNSLGGVSGIYLNEFGLISIFSLSFVKYVLIFASDETCGNYAWISFVCHIRAIYFNVVLNV